MSSAVEWLCDVSTDVELQLEMSFFIAAGEPDSPPPGSWFVYPLDRRNWVPDSVLPTASSQNDENTDKLRRERAEKILGRLADSMAMMGVKAYVDNSGEASNAQSQAPGAWALAFHPDLQEKQNDEEYWLGVVVKSPIFEAHNIDTLNLPHVLSCLKVVPIVLNDQTRVRVLARPSQDEFTLGQLTRLVSILWASEPLISQIHGPSRGPNSPSCLGLQFTKLADDDEPIDFEIAMRASGAYVKDPWDNRLSPDRRPIKLLDHPGALTAPRYRHGFQAIQRPDSLFELANLLEPRVFCSKDSISCVQPAYGFGSFLSRADKPFVAFNQHCGTFDDQAILHWARLCTNLVAFSLENLACQSIRATTELHKQVLSPEMTLFEFLCSRGLGSAAKYYEDRKASAHPHLLDLDAWPILHKSLGDDRSLLSTGRLFTGVDVDDASELLRRIRQQVGNSTAQQAANTRSNGHYTFGIEFEFLVPSISSQSKLGQSGLDVLPWASKTRTAVGIRTRLDPNPDDQRNPIRRTDCEISRLTETLNESGIFATSTDAICEAAFGARNRLQNDFRKKGRLFLAPCIKPEWQTWCFYRDASLLQFIYWKGYAALGGVELMSPILRDEPKSWESVLDVITSLREKRRLTVDRSCGTHINIGTGLSPVPFHTIRKLACLMYCAEPVIYSLCHPEREQVCDYSRPLRSRDVLQMHWRPSWNKLQATDDFKQHVPVEKLSHKDAAILKRLWTAPNRTILSILLQTTVRTRSCLSVERAVECARSDLQLIEGAVEFRYLEGTLDPDLVLRFAQLMMAFYRFADRAPVEAWHPVLCNVLASEKSGYYPSVILKTLLQQLGLGEDFGFWSERVARHRQVSCISVRECLEMRPGYAKDRAYFDTLEILPPVSEGTVKYLRENICRRAGRPSHGDGPRKAQGEEKQARRFWPGSELQKAFGCKYKVDELAECNVADDVTDDYRLSRLAELEASDRNLDCDETGVSSTDRDVQILHSVFLQCRSNDGDGFNPTSPHSDTKSSGERFSAEQEGSLLETVDVREVWEQLLGLEDGKIIANRMV